ncbi:c-type cytochrome [Marinomonas shanghaiensis]|uniref:c-type cytochrome n=1 Tax=Marinomonas shanghaiensis TaxID=2202418 RepID=UPI001E3DA9BC|nr:c-type cytochrome [Marinomonas shanghaiensis]
MPFIRPLHFYRCLPVSLGIYLLALFPLHGIASTETHQASQPYSGRPVTEIYNTYCIACHMSGVAGAPRFGQYEDWQPRIDKGMDTLLEHVIKGFNAMPPKGLCFDCNESEIAETIHYMIDNSSNH